MMVKILRKKQNTLLLLVLSFAAFLRFWKISELMRFTGDYGWYYLSAKKIFENGEIPLVGIASSVPVLRQGAIFTWFLATFLFFGKFNPVSGAILTGICGVASVFLVYKIVAEWFGKRMALISSLLVETSPFVVITDRSPYVIGPMFLLILVNVLLLSKIVKGKKLYFLLGLTFSLLFQIELAGFLMLPLIFLVLLLNKVKISIINILKIFAGIIIGLTPFFIWDFKQGVFIQTLGFVGWLGSKIYEGLFSLFKPEQNSMNFLPFLELLKKIIFPYSLLLSLSLSSVSILLMILLIKHARKKLAVKYWIILLFLFIPTIGFFLRGIYSESYMPLLFFPIIVLISKPFSFLIDKKKNLGLIVLSLFVFSNLYFLFQNNFSFSSDQISLKKRLEVVDFIIDKVDNNDFNLIYIGPGYQYPSSADNWKYLFWWRGNEPVFRSTNNFVIIENPYRLGKNHELIKDFGLVNVAQLKKE